MHIPTCLGFHVECGTMFKGVGVTVMGFILFIGSVYLLLSAILGRWMAYLLIVVTFAGWMAVLSVMWLTGFFISGGLPGNTHPNTGPNGQPAAWTPLHAGDTPPTGLDPKYAPFSSFPNAPWKEITNPTDPDVQAAASAAETYLALQANTALGIYDPFAENAITSTQFSVDHVEFATGADGKTKLSIVVAHFANGGPRTIV